MEKTVLKDNWFLMQAEAGADIGALIGQARPEAALPVREMPMEVADVLIDQNVIDLPWKPGLCEQSGWIAQSDWVYLCDFTLADAGGFWRLSCAGLDVFAEIYLNGSKAASHANALYPLEAKLPGGLLRSGRNTIAVVLRSTENRLLSMTPGMNGKSLHERAKSVNLRKNLNDFTGYLGTNPYFIRMGVFGEIALIREENGLIEQACLDPQVSQDLRAGYLTLSCRGKVRGGGRLRVTVTPPDGDPIVSETALDDGDFSITPRLQILRPQLWYPRGYGGQPIYTVQAVLFSGSAVADEKTWRTGFRKLEMPSPLHFVINEVPVRLYGGNWAPHSALSECWDEARARKLLDMAVQGNYNTIRLWACDSPVPQSFYDYADELGLMLWQDFYDVCTWGGDFDRLNNLTEAEFLIGRVRHHPGILIWCGGNESLSFYHWAHDGLPMPGKEVLEKELRGLCERLDPSRPYIPESPYGGNDYNDPREWDTHCYTNYSFVPGYDWANFVTEDFRISSPPLRSMRRFMPENHIWPEDYTQVHLPGDLCELPPSWIPYTAKSESELKFGPLWEYYDACDAESMAHRVSMAAAGFYRGSIERLRRGRPSGADSQARCCGGYLAWKLNDSWPEIYGSKVDYFLEPYLPYFFMKRAYEPVLLSFDVGNFLHIWLVNDSAAPVSGRLVVKLFHITENKVTREASFMVSSNPDESVDVADLTEIFQTFRRQNILFAQLIDNRGQVLARTTAIAGVERYIRFPKATLSLSVSGDMLTLTTDQYAHCIYLGGDEDGDEFGWGFDDNYFSLVPGEVKTVKVFGPHQHGTISARDFYSGIVSTAEFGA